MPLSGAVPMTRRTADHPLEAGRRVGASARRLRLRPWALRPLLLGLACYSLWAGSAVLWHAWGPPLLLNLTASLPPGLYLLLPVHPLTHGTLVVFPPPATVAPLLVARGYLAPHTPLLKPVAALPGDAVCVQDEGVFIQGLFVAPVASVDGAGRRLPRWRGCVTLADGEVFVLSTWSPRSVDSRYFGPVRVSTIAGVARPLWTWAAPQTDGEDGGTRRRGEWGQDKGTPAGAPLSLHNQRLRNRQRVYVPVRGGNDFVHQWVMNRLDGMPGGGYWYADAPR